MTYNSEEKLNWKDAKEALKTWRYYVHYLAYFGAGSGVASLSLFSPTIVAGMGYKGLNAQLYTVPPYAVAYVGALTTSYISDKMGNRGIVAGSSFAMATVAFIIMGKNTSLIFMFFSLPCDFEIFAYTLRRIAALPGENFKARYGLLCIACTGVFGGLPALCAWVGDNSRTTTAGGLVTALNIAFSGPGQIIGVWIYRAQDAPVYRLGHALNAGFVSIGAISSFSLYFYYKNLNKKLVGTNEQRWYV